MFYEVGLPGAAIAPLSTFWNPTDAFNATLSHRTTRVVTSILAPNSGAGWRNCELVSGKYQWEIDITGLNPADSLQFGFKNAYDTLLQQNNSFANRQISNGAQNLAAALYSSAAGVTRTGTVVTVDTTGNVGFAQSDRIKFNLDITTNPGKIWIAKNGTQINGGNPVTGANPQFTIPTSSTYPWQFQFWGFKNVLGREISFNACFDGSPFPAVSPLLPGYTSGIPMPAANFYPAWNLRNSTNFYRHLDDTISIPNWRTVAVLFFGESGSGQSSAPMLAGNKYYQEIVPDGLPASQYVCGIQDFGALPNVGLFALSYNLNAGVIASNYGVVDPTGVPTATINDVIAFSVDNPAGKIWLRKNGVYVNGGNPAAGTNPQVTGIPNQAWAIFHSCVDPGGFGYRLPANFTGASPTGYATGVTSCPT